MAFVLLRLAKPLFALLPDCAFSQSFEGCNIGVYTQEKKAIVPGSNNSNSDKRQKAWRMSETFCQHTLVARTLRRVFGLIFTKCVFFLVGMVEW
jgi:hypothetical protein